MNLLKPASLQIGFGPIDKDGSHLFTHEETFVAPVEDDGFLPEDIASFTMEELIESTVGLVKTTLEGSPDFQIESSIENGVGRIKYSFRTSRQLAFDMMMGEMLMNSTLGSKTFAELLVGAVAGGQTAGIAYSTRRIEETFGKIDEAFGNIAEVTGSPE